MALCLPQDHTHHGRFPPPDECGKDTKAGPFGGHTLLRRLTLAGGPPYLSFDEPSFDGMTVRESSTQPSFPFVTQLRLASHPTALPALSNFQFFPLTGPLQSQRPGVDLGILQGGGDDDTLVQWISHQLKTPLFV